MERERLFVYVTTAEERDRPKPLHLDPYYCMLSRYYKAKEQYVDELTECQQNAVNLLRIMDIGDWVEGIGCRVGWVKSAYSKVARFSYVFYVLDC
jgi:hypothetical protein